MKKVMIERSLEMNYIERGKAVRFYGAVQMSGCILRYREVFYEAVARADINGNGRGVERINRHQIEKKQR